MIKVEKYFSNIICSSGYCSTYNTIYKKDPDAKVYIVRDGCDYERAVFFKKLLENLRGYNITLFNPFYDESTDGIYIKNLNAYILSVSDYNNISPILPETWEKTISITESKTYPKDLLRKILIGKATENNHYKNACKVLSQASLIKERIHNELSPFLNEDKIINYIHRFCLRHIKRNGKGEIGKIRFLSSPTPLGFHTHYDTIFEMAENFVNITDETGFAGAIILGVIKSYALKEKIEMISSPSYFGKDFYQFLLFPTNKLSLCISDTSHPLPFNVQNEITVSRFFTDSSVLTNRKIKALLSVENSLLDKAILSIYEGRDERFKYNNLITGFSNFEKAKECADEIAKSLLN